MTSKKVFGKMKRAHVKGRIEDTAVALRWKRARRWSLERETQDRAVEETIRPKELRHKSERRKGFAILYGLVCEQKTG